MYNALCRLPVRKLEPNSPQQCHQPLNPQFLSDGYYFSQDQYCTLESSLLSVDYPTYNTSSAMSFSPNESTLTTETNEPCLIEDVDVFNCKFKELEAIMYGAVPDLSFLENRDNNFPNNAVCTDIGIRRQMMEAFTLPRVDLKQLLIACAMAVSNDDLSKARFLMSELRLIVSVSGDPVQRLGAYMLEGLVARLSFSGSSIYKSLKLREPAGFELLSYMHTLYEVCPYFKFGYMSANGAIAEAMKDENMVHIIDFQIGQGSQWVPLIQAFAARPRGPPVIRITGIDNTTSAFARGGGLNIIGRRLSKLANTFKVPFEFQTATMSGSEVFPSDLGVRPGEALAVNFAYILHHVPDESVTTENHRDRLLRMVKGLNPKVVTLVEQEFNTNTAAFYPRFREALDYYTAMFESIDAALPRGDKERVNVEQHCLARDIVNVIACEGIDRVERHEPLGKWRSRFKMAGFSPCPLSSLVNETIKNLLKKYSSKYRVEGKDGAFYLGWLKRDLVVSSAWK